MSDWIKRRVAALDHQAKVFHGAAGKEGSPVGFTLTMAEHETGQKRVIAGVYGNPRAEIRPGGEVYCHFPETTAVSIDDEIRLVTGRLPGAPTSISIGDLHKIVPELVPQASAALEESRRRSKGVPLERLRSQCNR